MTNASKLDRQRLAGKVALVTGASAGIGRAVAIALAAEGAHLIATGRREAELRSLLEQCAQVGGSARYLAGDITDGGFVRELAKFAGDVDILVNNAGILTYAPFLELTAAQCEDMFRINVLAAIDVGQRIGEIMTRRKRGHIIMMTSLGARTMGPLRSVYGATKHALAGITKGMRIEFKQYGIKVTEIAPGMVDTEIRNSSTHPETIAAFKNLPYVPLTPQDVAEAVVYAVTTSATCVPDLIELNAVGC